MRTPSSRSALLLLRCLRFAFADETTPATTTQYVLSGAAGLGACYDLRVHECGCAADECAEAKCLAKGFGVFFWSERCSVSCDPATCPADVLPTETASVLDLAVVVANTTCQFVAGVVPPVGALCPQQQQQQDDDDNATTTTTASGGASDDGGSATGACYDVTVHECGCQANACSEPKCEEIGRIWTSECPDHCDPVACAQQAEEEEHEGGEGGGDDGGGASDAESPATENGNSTVATTGSGGTGTTDNGGAGTTTTTTTDDDERSILDTLAELGSCDLFLAAVETARLVSVFELPGPYTLFAPTDVAFRAHVLKEGNPSLDEDSSVELLTNHLVPTAKYFGTLTDGDSLTTVARGRPLEVRASPGGSVTVDGALVLAPDLLASNGVAHVVDQVLRFRAENRDDEDDSSSSSVATDVDPNAAIDGSATSSSSWTRRTTSSWWCRSTFCASLLLLRGALVPY